MTYTEAQTEFSIRLYRWAKTAQEKEILEGFPSFHSNKDRSILRCRYFQTLDHHSKSVFGQGLLQKRHQIAVKALGEVISDDAETLMRREETFQSQNIYWVIASARERILRKQTPAKQREIKKAMATRFRAAFGDQCLPPDSTDRNLSLNFRMTCHGWIVRTWFEFGRWEHEIACHHDIGTGKLITKEEPQVLFANCLGFGLNYGNEIGIGSGWEHIAVEDVESTCLTVVEHCRRMFDLFPVLLENLDLQLLTK